MAHIKLYADGGCSGNNFRFSQNRKMVAVVADNVGNILFEETRKGGSNNVAELWAVMRALLWAKNNGFSEVNLFTDSRNNFAWVLGQKVGKNLNDRESVLELKGLINQLRLSIKLKMFWVPRGENVAGHYIEQKYNL